MKLKKFNKGKKLSKLRKKMLKEEEINLGKNKDLFLQSQFNCQTYRIFNNQDCHKKPLNPKNPHSDFQSFLQGVIHPKQRLTGQLCLMITIYPGRTYKTILLKVLIERCFYKMVTSWLILYLVIKRPRMILFWTLDHGKK